MAADLVQDGLRNGTKKTYSTAQKTYMQFCLLHHMVPMPASEMTILRYLAYLHIKKLAPSTIKVYLASLHSLHELNGYPAPDTTAYRIRLALRAITDQGASSKQSSPITFVLLQFIIDNVMHKPNGLLYATMLAVGFFGALRGCEYAAVYSQHGLISAPSMDQVQFISDQGRLAIIYTLKKSKTSDKPIQIPIGCSTHRICAVCLLVEYIRARFAASSYHPKAYLFTFPDGRPVPKHALNSVIKTEIQCLGLNPTGYTTHSLRSGAATTAGQLGFSENQIKQLGHWSSSAYLTYVQHSQHSRLQFSQRLSQQVLQ